MHHPFWLAFVVPMGAWLNNSHAYHELVCALMLGGGVQFGCRQIVTVLIAVGGSTLRVAKFILLLLQLAAVLLCRVALFFPLAWECIQEVQVEDPAWSHSIIGTTLLMGCFNILAVLDSVRVATLWCGIEEGGGLDAMRTRDQSQERLRSLELSSVTIDSQAATSADLSSSPAMPARNLPSRAGRYPPLRKKYRAKPRRHVCIRDAPSCAQEGKCDIDPSHEEMVFGFVVADFDATADSLNIGHADASIFRTAATQGSKATPPGPLGGGAAATRTEARDTAAMRTQSRAQAPAQQKRLQTCAHGNEHACNQQHVQMRSAAGESDDNDNGSRMCTHQSGGHYPDGSQFTRCGDAKQLHVAGQKEVDWRCLRDDAPSSCSGDVLEFAGSDAHVLRRTCSSLDSVRIPIVNHHLILASGNVPTVSHYAILGVPRVAAADEVRKAFHKLSVKFHPDKNPANAANAEVLFMRIKEAYDCLIEPSKRRRYDRHRG